MKTLIAGPLLVELLGAVLLAQQAEIREALVSDGSVVAVDAKGTLTLRVEQSGRMLQFPNLNRAPIFYANGRRASFATIESGQHATVYYSPSVRGWVVDRVMIPSPPPPIANPGQPTPPQFHPARFHGVTR